MRSSHKPQPFRSNQENIAYWLLASIILDLIILASGSIQEAAPHVSELLCYVEGNSDKIQNVNLNKQHNSRQLLILGHRFCPHAELDAFASKNLKHTHSKATC